MRKLSRGPAGVILLACLAGMGSFSCQHWAPKARNGATPSDGFNDYLASRLTGREVENEDGQELAVLDDLLVDFHNGKARYAVVATGGVLGLGKRLRAVPCSVLSAQTTKKSVVAIDIKRIDWQQAPVLNHKTSAELTRPAVTRVLERYYRQAAAKNDSEKPREIDAVPAPTGHPEGAESSSPGEVRELQFVRDLKGYVVFNRQQERIGRVMDLLVDLSGRRAAYAIISAEGLLNKDEHFAVPLQLLNPGKKRSVFIDANRRMFEQAQLFSLVGWQASHGELSGIFRFGSSAGGSIAVGAENMVLAGAGSQSNPVP